MNISLKILNINNQRDVQQLRYVMSNIEGIIACEINKSKRELNVVFDERVIQAIDIISELENYEYSVM